jgi:hypothetical protein
MLADTNNTWSESITRAEIQDMYDITISDVEWETLRERLDEAVADIFSEVRFNHDI